VFHHVRYMCRSNYSGVKIKKKKKKKIIFVILLI